MNYLQKKGVVVLGIAAFAIAVLMSGCATDISSKSYSEDSVGEVSNTYSGVVVKVRTVKVGPDQLSKNHTGAIAGGLGGGLIGSQLLGGPVATIGLAGAGAVGGAFAEKSLRTQQGLEITVRLASGELRTVVQGNDVAFKKGEHILLLIYAQGRSKVVKEDEESQDQAA